MAVFGRMMQMPVQFVVLGVGDKRYQDFFESTAKEYPGKAAARLTFDNDLAHLIEA